MLTLVISLASAQPASAVDSITGTVLDSSTGLPIAGVSVAAFDDLERQVGATAITAADGTYALVDLPDANYYLKFSKTGYLDVWYDGYNSHAEALFVTSPATLVDLSMNADTISGTVRDGGTNAVLQGVSVAVLDADNVQKGPTATTAADGTYSISLGSEAFGQYYVRYTKAGYLNVWYDAYTSFSAAVDNGSSVGVPTGGTDELIYPDTITGTVTDSDTNALLAGVTVTLYKIDQSEIDTDTTAADGTYAVSVGADGAGDYVISFARTGYALVFHNGETTLPAAVSSSAVSMPGAAAVDQLLQPGTAQTITFAALAARTLSENPFTVSATASSELDVTFSSTTTAVCTVSGTSVTLVTTGTCTIRASQAGDDTWGTAPDVDRSFVVNAATTDPAPEEEEDEREEDEQDDDPAPVELPDVAQPGASPVVLRDTPVALPESGIFTRPVELRSGEVVVSIAAGVTVTHKGSPAAVIIYPPVLSAEGTELSLRTSLGNDVRFSPPLSVTLPLPSGRASAFADRTVPQYVAVALSRGAVIGCLGGTQLGDTFRFAVSRAGTFALRGPERPAVASRPSPVRGLAGLHSRWAGQSVTATACPGQLVDVTVLLTNVGTGPWIHGTPSQVNLGSSAPPGNTRDFELGVLYAPLFNRDRFATTVESRVEPGETGTFAFRVRAPSWRGTYRIYARPVVEGIAWLADEGIHLELEVR